jgi:hypothetical protein
MYRTIEITYTAGGSRGQFNLCFVEYHRQPSGSWSRVERECVKLDPDDPVYDYAEAWIKGGHIPIEPKTKRLT